MRFVYDDGGRAAAGFKGQTGDCVTRSIAIFTGLPYQTVYDGLNETARRERPRGKKKRSSARLGVHKPTIHRYLADLHEQDPLGHDHVWVPLMQIGSGCQVHLRDDELPPGRLLVSVSRHLTAVIDGVIHDTHDPSRDGTRCVYGLWCARDAQRWFRPREAPLPWV